MDLNVNDPNPSIQQTVPEVLGTGVSFVVEVDHITFFCLRIRSILTSKLGMTI